MDFKGQVCHVFEIPEKVGEQPKYIGIEPLSKWHDGFIFTPEYIVELKKFIRKAQDWTEDNCK